MRVVIRNLDEIEGYVSVARDGDFHMEAAAQANQLAFEQSVRSLFKYYKASRRVHISPLEFLLILPTWLNSQTFAYFENPPKRQILPGLSPIEKMLARRERIAAK